MAPITGCLGVTAASSHEIYEWAVDHWFGQSVFIGETDTITDLADGFLGAAPERTSRHEDPVDGAPDSDRPTANTATPGSSSRITARGSSVLVKHEPPGEVRADLAALRQTVR
jgi:hypothetical protein